MFSSWDIEHLLTFFKAGQTRVKLPSEGAELRPGFVGYPQLRDFQLRRAWIVRGSKAKIPEPGETVEIEGQQALVAAIDEVTEISIFMRAWQEIS